jgi:DnaJ domain
MALPFPYHRFAAKKEVMSEPQYREKFHGRVRGSAQQCGAPGCQGAGEFRAPLYTHDAVSGDRPRQWQWLCLEHVREFNQRYNFFNGMNREEIEAAQMPMAGWARETRAFTQGGADKPPSWSDFHDPLDAIASRFRTRMREAAPKVRSDGKSLSPEDRRALDAMGLPLDADRRALRARYSELVRRYHPDRNGGDRSFEAKLQRIVEAYQHLRTAPAFV